MECNLKNSTAAALQTWLGQHAGRLRSLVVISIGVMVLRPPWAALSQLQTLNLRYLKLPPIIMQGRNNVLLPHLRELVLVACSIHSISCLLQLAGSQHLTRLTVRCYERCVHAERTELSVRDDSHVCKGTSSGRFSNHNWPQHKLATPA